MAKLTRTIECSCGASYTVPMYGDNYDSYRCLNCGRYSYPYQSYFWYRLICILVILFLATLVTVAVHSTYKEECSETTVPQVVWEKHVAEGNVRPTWNIGDKVVNYVTGKHGEIVGKNCGAEHKWKIRYSNHTSLHDARNLKNVAHPGT